MPARKIPERVCVLVNQQPWKPFVGACRAKDHGHLTGSKAEQTVENGSATWVKEIWTDGRGKEHERFVPAIRLNGKKIWKGRISDRMSSRPMRVMQLVSN
jgi:hypothetical protein